VDNLQKAIKFKKTSRARVNLYDLSYANQQPEVAQRVIQSVITVFIESSIGRSKDDTDSARVFIQKQLSSYEKRLFESENRLKLFKQKNVGMLPSETGDYYARLQQAKASIKQVKLSLKEVDRAIIPLQKELNIIVEAAKIARPRMAQLVVIKGRNIPSDLNKAGLSFLILISIN